MWVFHAKYIYLLHLRQCPIADRSGTWWDIGQLRLLFPSSDVPKHPTFYNATMKSIPAAQFKAKCLSILDRVDPEGIIITKHGKPVATLLPVRASSSALIGSMRGKIVVKGDILSTGIQWDAQ